MKNPASIYTHCDELEKLPEGNRQNWLHELKRLSALIPSNATVLQIGSMDATRIMRLLEKRPDLKMTGIEIDGELADLARKNIQASGKRADIVTGDITKPPSELKRHNYVLCLNNTLGYIPDEDGALKHMRRLGDHVIISVYGEAFTDALAKQYFETLGLEIDRIEKNRIHFKDFSSVKRYTRREIEQWKGTIEETPIGYLCIL